ncbi:MAG: HNH endonuclease, partial [Microbacteriaceae bacterium]
PAGWTEIHHVHEWANGGPTNTDNGVSLCWYHHHSLETSGWQIRMTRGVPHLKAPPWLDPTDTWRPASKARTRTRN